MTIYLDDYGTENRKSLNIKNNAPKVTIENLKDKPKKSKYRKQNNTHQIWKNKLVIGILTFIIFITMPFAITMTMTGVIEGEISDSLNEIRRVKIKYIAGSKTVDLSNYIAGVMAARFDVSQEPEVLKLESILIRTEIYKAMGDEMVIDSSKLGMEYITQKEMKNKWQSNYENNYNMIVDSISATSGMILGINGAVITPYYHYISNGKTRDGKEVLGDNYSYLSSVQCDKDIESPEYLTGKTISVQDFVKIIKDKYSNSGLTEENIMESIQIVSRCSAGYINQMQIGNITMTGEDFAKTVEINSNDFTLGIEEDKIKITSKGKGAGLGISLFHADIMAKNGSNYNDIINYFYKNVSIMSE